MPTEIINEVLEFTNASRESERLEPLSLNYQLVSTAQGHEEDPETEAIEEIDEDFVDVELLEDSTDELSNDDLDSNPVEELEESTDVELSGNFLDLNIDEVMTAELVEEGEEVDELLDTELIEEDLGEDLVEEVVVEEVTEEVIANLVPEEVTEEPVEDTIVEGSLDFDTIIVRESVVIEAEADDTVGEAIDLAPEAEITSDFTAQFVNFVSMKLILTGAKFLVLSSFLEEFTPVETVAEEVVENTLIEEQTEDDIEEVLEDAMAEESPEELSNLTDEFLSDITGTGENSPLTGGDAVVFSRESALSELSSLVETFQSNVFELSSDLASDLGYGGGFVSEISEIFEDISSLDLDDSGQSFSSILSEIAESFL